MLNRHVVGLVLMLAFGAQVEAATVSLTPSSPSVGPGSPFTINLLMNALDAPGSHPGVYSGEIVINFDPVLLTYGSFSPAAPVSLLSGPTVGTDGSEQTVTLKFQSTSDNGIMGSFAFMAKNPNSTSIAQIGLADANDFFGSFISQVPTNQPFYPAFSGTSVTVSAVPLPGAGWLLLTGAGLIGLRARPRPCHPSGKDA